ncbi:MAG: hypothetical protein KDK70_33545, partial [Myxococcales bacterium]|nr:hypothetical protein [Myxococcales bacterium]
MPRPLSPVSRLSRGPSSSSSARTGPTSTVCSRRSIPRDHIGTEHTRGNAAPWPLREARGEPARWRAHRAARRAQPTTRSGPEPPSSGLGAAHHHLARRVDLTFIAEPPRPGTLHPITQTRRELERVFRRLGFDVADGPHVEAELYNFDKLNILPAHPARDMQDTFFVAGRPADGAGEDDGGAPSLVLRTHTSPVQARTMLRYG